MFCLKKLNQLIPTDYDIDIIGITTDSRKVKPGFLFVATKGFNVDHYDYILDAINNGAVALVVDREGSFSIPTIYVSDIDDILVNLCQKFFDVCVSDFHFIGITGTDGKTTTAMITRNLLNLYMPTAYIGTNGFFCKDIILETSNTTPCIEELYNYLSIVKKLKCKYVVLEVSSEALLHKRVDSILFDVVAFTNITEDHLNVHKTIKNYRNCKFHLADLCKKDGIVIINGDDFNCCKLSVNDKIKFGFSKSNDCVISNVEKCQKYVNFIVNYLNKKYVIHSPFLGEYNIYNVTLSWLIVSFFVTSLESLADQIISLPKVFGRREIFTSNKGFDIMLDYAHTENGIYNLLKSLSHYNKIIVVTGAAGGREVRKRPKIGDILFKYADYIVFTEDDPRFEDPLDIANEIIGKHKEKDYVFIKNREKAINYALSIADLNSVVAIIGKGRDNYMAIKDLKIPYSDYDIIKKYLKKQN